MARKGEGGAWIEMKGPDEWDPEFGELMEGTRDPETGEFDNVLMVHSLSSDSLRAHLALYRVAMRGTRGLPKVDREMVALVVSKENHCHY